MKKSVLPIITMLLLVACVSALPQKGANAAVQRIGGTLIIADLADVKIMNPLLLNEASSAARCNQIFSSLVRVDLSAMIVPDLAETWSISEDGMTITFNLRKGVKWHDGEDFTSADVAFTYGHYLSIPEQLPQSYKFKNIGSIETPDPYTVIFHMKQIDAAILLGGFGSGTGAGIIPKHLYEGTDLFENPHNWDPIGTGPFKVEKHDRGDKISLIRNDNYFKESLPYLDKIIYKVMPSMTSQLVALETGEAHQLWGMPPPQEISRLQTVKGISVIMAPGITGSVIYLANNFRNPYLSDLRVRQAMAHGMDKEVIVEVAAGVLGRVATGPISSTNSWAYTADVPKYEYNPAKAEQILDDAGYPRGDDGIRFSIRTFPRAGDPQRESAAEIFKSQMAEIGIDVDIQLIEWATLVSKVVKEGDYDTFWIGWGTGPDPNQLYGGFHSSSAYPGSWNIQPYSDPVVDQVLDDAVSTMNYSERAEYYYEFQRLMAEDLPYHWMWEVNYAYVSNDAFKDIPFGTSLAYENVWWIYGTTVEEIELTENVAVLTEDIAVLTIELEELSNRLESTSKELADGMTTISTSINILSETISGVENAVSGVEDDTAALTGTINTLQLMLGLTLIVAIISVALQYMRKS